MKHSTHRLVSVLALFVATAFVTTGCAKESSNDTKTDETATTAAKPAAAAARTAPAPAPTAKAEATAESGASCDGPKMAAHKEMNEGGECTKEAEGDKGCNTWDDAAAKVLKKEVPANATWQAFRVSGMTCGGCERRVIAKLGEIEGVVGVEADAELGQVRFATLPKSDKAAELARAKLGKLYKIEKKL